MELPGNVEITTNQNVSLITCCCAWCSLRSCAVQQHAHTSNRRARESSSQELAYCMPYTALYVYPVDSSRLSDNACHCLGCGRAFIEWRRHYSNNSGFSGITNRHRANARTRTRIQAEHFLPDDGRCREQRCRVDRPFCPYPNTDLARSTRGESSGGFFFTCVCTCLY